MLMINFRIRMSGVPDENLAEFILNPIDPDIKSIPGMVKNLNYKEKLNNIGILNTYNLLGTFLLLKEDNQSVQQHCDAMYRFLKNAGITRYLSGIVVCIAEKADVMMPGICNLDTLRSADRFEVSKYIYRKTLYKPIS